ncbi:DUF1588 domain-containing protein [Lignipirellula cremea]|uniref:Planctomycete cytochrome C n=1 Tax=Lignipirellula cremea TaxID=2528010 RepID=A0A518E4V8_9BACT|nr:DUF1588 domain-containing protein [Lignipirellula cremea]QDU99108.1 hypothetical protein Pla8534_70190 [Lignipirellula cremea]
MPAGTSHPLTCRRLLLLLSLLLAGPATIFSPALCQAEDFDREWAVVVQQKCLKCHGGKEINGEVDFRLTATAEQFLADPELLDRMIDAIASGQMPPETEPPLPEQTQTQFVAALKTLLRQAAADDDLPPPQLRRLNRFQYNNSVKDLFRLNRDIFPLPEKLMTRQDDYLRRRTGQMPDQVRASSQALQPAAGLAGVQAFPKDLRAEHGFDNQANQLTLSPLLLDAYLRLSVSIVESPDFNAANVGVWNDLFQPPAPGVDQGEEIRRRLAPFLRHAFRGPVEDAALERYGAFAAAKLAQGMPFTDCMKKTASAVLSSPLFLYRSAASSQAEIPFEVANNLSYFLWASCPDEELLDLAEDGRLLQPEVLNATIDRMLADPRIERFLDAFPAQWMQLENLLAVTPDPAINRYFSLDQNHPASLQMVLEPLLLFDAMFVEDRPIRELIAPAFSYRSDFLKTWYASDLEPPPVDLAAVAAQNAKNDQQRQTLQAALETARSQKDALIAPVRTRLLQARNQTADKPLLTDLKPYAAWEFNGDLKDSVGNLDLRAEGKIEYADGMVVLNKSYLISQPLPIDLQARTFEVWCEVDDLNQRGGGLMGIQGPNRVFDTIVLGERKPLHWISGSNNFQRTEDFPDSTPETAAGKRLHLTMVYAADGVITLYRNGVPYGQPYRKGAFTFPAGTSSILFGLRHLPASGNRFLSVRIDQARLFDRALTADEAAALASGSAYLPREELLQAFTAEQKAAHAALEAAIQQAESALAKVPANQNPEQVRQEAQKRFDDEIRRKLQSQTFARVATDDPRYGGVITNAAMLSMTSGTRRTHPIARGAWVIEVILNDPPNPPPNDIPPLREVESSKPLTVRERFAIHRSNPSCAGCHSQLDPLGFALENFDITGRWRDKYENGLAVDASGVLMRKHPFTDVVEFKASLMQEERRFAEAFTAHLLRFALARELRPADSLTLEAIIDRTEPNDFKFQSLLREVARTAASLPPFKDNPADP